MFSNGEEMDDMSPAQTTLAIITLFVFSAFLLVWSWRILRVSLDGMWSEAQTKVGSWRLWQTLFEMQGLTLLLGVLLGGLGLLGVACGGWWARRALRNRKRP